MAEYNLQEKYLATIIILSLMLSYGYFLLGSESLRSLTIRANIV